MYDCKDYFVIKLPHSNDDRHSHSSIAALVRSDHNVKGRNRPLLIWRTAQVKTLASEAAFVPAVTDPHVAAAAQFPSRRLVWHHALPSRASDFRPPTATGGRRQSISFSPAHLAPVAAIASFILLAQSAHGYRTRRYSRPPPTWLQSLQSKGLAAIPTPLEVPPGAHVSAGSSVWPQKLRSTVRASGSPP